MITNIIKKKSKCNNAGFSLVEVIVSMLILALLVTPLLRTFIVSAQTNLSSRTSQYATNVAQNVLEGLKLYGAENAAKQFNDNRENAVFNIVPKIVLNDKEHGIGFYETDNNFNKLTEGLCSYFEEKFVKNEAQKYYYVINGINEGTALFNVRISLNAASYLGSTEPEKKGKQNDYMMPDLSDLDVRTSALIHPNVNNVKSKYDEVDGYTINWDDSHTFEDTAITEYYGVHQKYIEDKNALLDEEEEELFDVLSIDNLKKYIERKTIVSIIKTDNGKYKVGCNIEYRLNQKNTFGDYDEILCDNTIPDNSIRKSKEINTYMVYTTKEFTELTSIYLFHIPLTNDYKKDTIFINNTTEDKINIYIAEQTSAIVNKAIKNTIYVDVAEDNVVFYMNPDTDTVLELDLDGYAYNNITYNLVENTNYKKLLIQDMDTYDRIYEVEVEVYKSGTDKKLATLTSTISK